MFLRGILTATIKRVRFWHLWSTALIQTEMCQGNKTCTVVLSIMLNSFQSTSLSIRFTIQQKVNAINSFWLVYRTCHFAEWPLDFYHASGFVSPCIVWYSNNEKIRIWLHISYTMGCPPVRGGYPRALASRLLYVQVDNPWYNYFIPSTSV